jgi:ABC-type branched-subunit amino acid transport system substrate-binding protein
VDQILARERRRPSSPKICVAVAVAVAVAVLVLAAGCSSKAKSGSGSSKGDIVVGGVQDGTATGIDIGFKARIARFNNAGGLDGRKIKLLDVLKDGGSLTGDVTAVQTLVLKDKVFAVTPISSQTFSPASAQLLNQRHVPFIGWGVNPAMCVGDAAFPIVGCQGSSQYQSLAGIRQLAEGLGKPVRGLKVAMIGLDTAGSKAGMDGLKGAATRAGATVVFGQASIPPGGAADYSPYVQGLLAVNPDTIMLLTDFGPGAALTGALRQAGYGGGIWNPTAYVPGVLSAQPRLAAALNGSLVVAQFPTQEEGAPAAKQIQADLSAIKAPTHLTLGLSVGWWSAEEFIQQLQATAGNGDVTSANFVKTIHDGWTIKPLEGGITELTFPDDQITWPGCSGLMQSDAKGQYRVKVKYVCNPKDTVRVSGG